MHIWIDADACPSIIKELVFRASARLRIPVFLVANRPLAAPPSSLITVIRVSRDVDAADAYITQAVAQGDLVITADVPLAAAVVRQGALALDPRGETYSAENIGARLAVRNLLHELRTQGVVQGGPAPLQEADRRKFAAALNTVLNTIARPCTPTPPKA
jgi:uncharacterized protein YaiI (UPF0178 family)